MPDTLKIEFSGPKITADKFARGVSAFFNFVDEIGKRITGKPKAVRWIISVQPSSVILLAKPTDTEPQLIAVLFEDIENGIDMLNNKDVRPKHFSDTALSKLKDLASIITDKEPEIDKINVWTNGKRNIVSNKIVRHVESVLGVGVETIGSIEGKLQTISDRKGLKFFVWDVLTDEAIECYIDEELFEEAMKAFRKRVYVTGVIKHRKDGKPTSIKVEKIKVFPSRDELPSAEDVRGILKG